MYYYFIFGLATIISLSGIVFYGYTKVFSLKQYKILKEYEYKNSRIQLIANPQNNVCASCFEILEENDEIGRFPLCDHHFCQDCIHKQIDDSQSNLKKFNPCSMCMN